MSVSELLMHFYKNENTLSRISVEELRDVVSLSTIVLAESEYTDDLKSQAFEILCRIALLNRFSVAERLGLYRTLTHNLFVSTKFDKYNIYLEEIYASIYFEVEKSMPDYLLQEEEKADKNGPVIIITSQFLSVKHAPTRRVLDYAYTIKTKLGLDVKIINDAGMNLYSVPYINAQALFKYIPELSKVGVMNYKDTKFGFYQFDSKMPDLQGIANMIYNIRQQRPRLVINVGGSCLTSDLCRHFTKTATMNCSTSMPRGMSDFLVLCREIRKTDSERIGRLYPWQNVVEAVFNYIMPDDQSLKKYTREMLGIPEDAWLITSAGNRMAEELDAEFMAMIDDVTGNLPNTYFLIVGDVADSANLVAGLKNKDKIYFAGSLKDGSQAIRLSNLYIQPTRKGGGRAAFEALYYGVPVITTKYGDTWDVCGKQFEVESYMQMAEKIYSYYNDIELYQNAKEISKIRANKLEDMRSMFINLFHNLGVDYDES